MTLLSVNLNKVALVRNARHTRLSDARELAALVAGAPGIELNLEGNP